MSNKPPFEKVAILCYLDRQEDGSSFIQISNTLDIEKPTLKKYLDQLIDEGQITLNNKKYYRVGKSLNVKPIKEKGVIT